MGELIMMTSHMGNEFLKFFATFGLFLILSFMLLIILQDVFKLTRTDYFGIILDLFNAFNGITDFAEFTVPLGQSYVAILMYSWRILVISMLASMFIARYRLVWANIEAYRYLRIVQLKNNLAYDKYIGCITLSFFPLNILIMPFIPLIVKLRSPRISDFLLKFQYSIMMIFYSFTSLILIIPITPLLYGKILANSFYIMFNGTRQEYRGQNVVHLLRCIVLGLPLIGISVVVDFLVLPTLLFKSSKAFEHKY